MSPSSEEGSPLDKVEATTSMVKGLCKIHFRGEVYIMAIQRRSSKENLVEMEEVR